MLTSGSGQFDACVGARRYGDTIDHLFLNTPHMDRRCILGSNDYIAAHNAVGGVYSDTRKANLAAARAYCQANGGTE